MRGKPTIVIPDDKRKQAIASLRRFFANELDEEIGDLKAGIVYDYFLAEQAPTIYNLAIADAQGFFQERIADLDAVCYQAEFPFWPQRK